jgi:hypothetical protein
MRITTDGNQLDKHFGKISDAQISGTNTVTQRLSTNLTTSIGMHRGSNLQTNPRDGRYSENTAKQSPFKIFDNPPKPIQSPLLNTKITKSPHSSNRFSFGEEPNVTQSPEHARNRNDANNDKTAESHKSNSEYNIFRDTFGTQQFADMMAKPINYNPFEIDSDRIMNEKSQYNTRFSKSDNGTPTRITNSGNSKDDKSRSGKREAEEVEWPGGSRRSSHNEGTRGRISAYQDSSIRKNTNSRERVAKRNSQNARDPNLFMVDREISDDQLRGGANYTRFGSTQPLPPSFSDNGQFI